MKVHHLNLCTMCPYGGRLVSGGESGILRRGELVVHALLVETDKEGLVLVDTGFGLEDVRHAGRLGRGFLFGTQPDLREENTAIRQVEQLGFAPRDVRHIVCTHLDADHAGGLPDFPDAKVHVHARERAAALARQTFKEKQRYRPHQLAHGPKWETHEEGGETWMGFASVRAIADDVHLVPLPGHTRGHAAIAMRAPVGSAVEWLLHCGDAYFYFGEVETPPSCPPLIGAFQSFIAFDDDARKENRRRLCELRAREGSRIAIFSAHCAHEYKRAATGSRT